MYLFIPEGNCIDLYRERRNFTLMDKAAQTWFASRRAIARKVKQHSCAGLGLCDNNYVV
jgi:hypothetical protein